MNIHIAEKEEKKAVFALRYEVFVGEQNVPPEIEVDEEDGHALHIIAREGDVAIGCARVIISDNEAHIGRLAVKRSYRGQGVGSAVCGFIIEYCQHLGCNSIWLNSQLQAASFYEKLGFKAEGEVFEEAGIEHIRMSM